MPHNRTERARQKAQAGDITQLPVWALEQMIKELTGEARDFEDKARVKRERARRIRDEIQARRDAGVIES
jgi:hypothetical protein